MGTNFYLYGGTHIGKRSSAGRFCVDCNLTFCKGGLSRVHFDTGYHQWYETCPKCGSNGQGVSSFTWAISPEKVAMPNGQFSPMIYSEYGDLVDFNHVIRTCKIQFFESIGKYFS